MLDRLKTPLTDFTKYRNRGQFSFILHRLAALTVLAFAFSHGVLGLRQVLFDYIHGDKAHQWINWALLTLWLIISIIGAIAIIGGVSFPLS